MSILERKIDALMRFCAAETDEERSAAQADIQKIIKGQPAGTQAVTEAGDEFTIRRVLLELGVPDYLLGYDYLITAISAVAGKPDMAKGISKRLYPLVAKAHHTTAPRVERAIRHAVEVAWDRGDLGVLCKYFGNTADPMKGKSTNKEFIVRIASVIRIGV